MADFTLLMLAAIGGSGRLLVDDPFADLVAGGLHIIALVAVAAVRAGVGGIAHRGSN